MSARQKHPTPKLKEDQIVYYPLPELLPVRQRLAFNARLELLSLLASSAESQPCVLAQEQFTPQEARILLPLLENYPHHCPHEVLYASYYGGLTSEQAVERARRHLQEAIEMGTWDYEMRPARNTLSRLRGKLHAFGIGVLSILETGYLLTSLVDSAENYEGKSLNEHHEKGEET